MGKLLPLNRRAADEGRQAMLLALAGTAGDADQRNGDLGPAVALLQQNGWLQACLPFGAGGAGWGCAPAGAASALQSLRDLGRANLSLARLFEGHMNAVKLIALYGTPACQKRVFGRVAEGALLGVWGADAPGDPLRLEAAGNQWRLTGAKRFASGLGLVAEAVVTAAHSAGGVQLALVPVDEAERSDPSEWRMAGMRATRSGVYRMTGLQLHTGDLVGKPGDYLLEPHFEGGIWRYCAAHLGAAEQLYSLMREALLARGRAGDAVQQGRIVQVAIAIETARLWIARASEAVEASDAPPRSAAVSLLAREVTERCCREVLATVEHALGMAAHEEGGEVERIRRDLALFLCQAAPDAKRIRAAQALLEAGGLPEAL